VRWAGPEKLFGILPEHGCDMKYNMRKKGFASAGQIFSLKIVLINLKSNALGYGFYFL
jgi:hypothetical protein